MFQKVITRLNPIFKRNIPQLNHHSKNFLLHQKHFTRRSFVPTLIATGYGIFMPVTYFMQTIEDKNQPEPNETVNSEGNLQKNEKTFF